MPNQNFLPGGDNLLSDPTPANERTTAATGIADFPKIVIQLTKLGVVAGYKEFRQDDGVILGATDTYNGRGDVAVRPICLDRLQSNGGARDGVAQMQQHLAINGAARDALSLKKSSCRATQVPRDPPLTVDKLDQKMLARYAQIRQYEVTLSASANRHAGARPHAFHAAVGPDLKFGSTQVWQRTALPTDSPPVSAAPPCSPDR
jgi:hypothetical protein